MKAAADWFEGLVDVSNIVCNESGFCASRVGRIVEGVDHADGGGDDEDLDDNNG